VDRLRLDDAAAALVDLRAAEVGAVVEGGGERELLRQGEVGEDHHVELAVGEVGVGGDEHAPAEVASVGDGRVEGGALEEDAVVDLHPDRLVAVAEGGAEGSEEEGGLAAEPLGALVDELIGEAADAEAGDVEEGPDRRGPAGVDDAKQAEVHRAARAAESTDGLLQAAGEAQRALEIAAGARRDDRQIGARDGVPFRIDVGLDGLVEGAVAPDDGEHLDAIFPGDAGEASGVSGARGLGDIVVQALAAERLAERRQLAQGGASAGLGVEQQTDGGGCHGESSGKKCAKARGRCLTARGRSVSW
jgi:hypothetical protein